jgi:hypothetical protein
LEGAGPGCEVLSATRLLSASTGTAHGLEVITTTAEVNGLLLIAKIGCITQCDESLQFRHS